MLLLDYVCCGNMLFIISGPGKGFISPDGKHEENPESSGKLILALNTSKMKC